MLILFICISDYSRDTFSLIKNVDAYQKIIDIYCELITQLKADVVVGLEARGLVCHY